MQGELKIYNQKLQEIDNERKNLDSILNNLKITQAQNQKKIEEKIKKEEENNAKKPQPKRTITADKNIKISLSQDKKYIVSKFENLAPNLKEEDMDKLFDRFYTADKSRSDKNTGLGLAITKVLIEKLGHKIDAKLVNGSLIIEIKWNNLRGVSQ